MSNYSIAPGSVEKIYLKPIAKELLYRPRNNDSYFDILSCHATSYQERALGDLFVLGNVKFEGHEDNSYLISLVSSIAKREFYSQRSLQEQNSRLAFERTLKKLNEVLENFFNTNHLALDIGLMAIANESILISRIGNVKVSLSRNHEYIDVISNVELFDKSYNDNIQFSHIISGKIAPGDNFFAYIPFRSITSRERFVRASFIAQTQEEFIAKIASFSENTPTFNCCGIHIHLEQTKEIPAGNDPQPEESGLDMVQLTSNPALSPIMRPDTSSKHNGQRVSSTTKSNALMYGAIITMSFVVLSGIGYGGYKIFELLEGPAEFRTLASSIAQTEAQATGELQKGNIRHARELVYNALQKLGIFNISKANSLKAQLSAVISNADKDTTTHPVLFNDLSTNHKKERFQKIAVYGDTPVVTTSEGAVISVSQNSFTELGKLTEPDSRLFSEDSTVISISQDSISALDITNKIRKTIGTVSADDIKDAYIFKKNLYVLNSDNTISKYEDITHASTPKPWNKGGLEDTISHITVDGSVIGFTNQGHIITLYKGKKSNDFDPQLIDTPNTKLLTNEDSPLLVVIQPEFNKIFIIHKLDGSLQKSITMANGTTISDADLGSDDTLFILSPEGKIFSMLLN